MSPEKWTETWKEICFILSKSVSPKMNEKDFENQVVRAIETLGWKEFKNEIKRQPVLKIGHGKKLQPDLAVYDDSDEPIIAIEVKRPAEDLTKDDVSSQLHSYMRQLKAEFGLAIGGTIRFFYDGPLYSQKEPVLLCDIVFDEDSTDGQEFVSNINSESVAQRKHLPYLNKLINKVKEKRSISKLSRVLLTKETKDNILAYLRAEFIDYGSEIVEGALNSIDIQLNRKDPVVPAKKRRKTEPAPTTTTSRAGQVWSYLEKLRPRLRPENVGLLIAVDKEHTHVFKIDWHHTGRELMVFSKEGIQHRRQAYAIMEVFGNKIAAKYGSIARKMGAFVDTSKSPPEVIANYGEFERYIGRKKIYGNGAALKPTKKYERSAKEFFNQNTYDASEKIRRNILNRRPLWEFFLKERQMTVAQFKDLSHFKKKAIAGFMQFLTRNGLAVRDGDLFTLNEEAIPHIKKLL